MYVIVVHLTAEPGEHLVLAIVLSLPFIEGNFGHLSLCLLTGARARWLLTTAFLSGHFCPTKLRVDGHYPKTPGHLSVDRPL